MFSSQYSFRNLINENATTTQPSFWNRFDLKLSATQRLICFAVCFGSGLSCFLISSMYIPFLLFKARKFCIFFTVGSLMIMTSFAFLFGPLNHIKHTFSKDRLLFTSIYLGSLLATLYVSLNLQATLLTIIFASIQVVSMVWYFVSYLPHGHTTMKFFASMLTRSVSSTLPV